MAVFRYQSGDQPLDGYTIEYGLGRGGFGEVYYAVSDAGRQVALKEIQNFEDIELRGIGHCMNLKSQHLVSIFDVKYAADKTPWVIMEYVSGPSLRQLLDESPGGLGVEKALFFIRELAKGLSYLHSAGVVHRDMKPHNVFFEEGIVKIGDYSLSKVITTSHRSGHTMTVGSVHYMAPEISMGSYDKTVDIYAMGVILYEMLTGQPPYVGESMGEVLMKHLSSQPDVSNIDEPFASVIQKSMARDPADRYQTAQEMAEALFGDSVTAHTVGSFGPSSLSIVADRAAIDRKADHEVTTDRVADALATTQPMQRAETEDLPHPMYTIGRALRSIAMFSAMIPEDRSAKSVSPRDQIPAPFRWILAVATMLLVVGVAEILNQVFATYDYWQPNVGVPVMWTIVDAIALVGVLVIGTLLARSIIDLVFRANEGLLCRTIHVIVCGLLLLLVGLLRTQYQQWWFGSILDRQLPQIVVGLGVPILIQNWYALVMPTRRHRIRLWPALIAGMIAGIAGSFVGLPIACMVISSTAALAVQVIAAHGSNRDEKSSLESRNNVAESQQHNADDHTAPVMMTASNISELGV